MLAYFTNLFMTECSMKTNALLIEVQIGHVDWNVDFPFGKECGDIKLRFCTLNEKAICSNGNHNERPLFFTETICVLEKFSLVNILLSKKTTL